MKGSGQCRLCEKTEGDYVDKVKNPVSLDSFGVNNRAKPHFPSSFQIF